MDSSTTTTAGVGEADEWELCNDDGFVYKRKRRRVDPAVPLPPDPAAGIEAEEKKLRERKKKTLLKLKNQYRREIEFWEFLSNTLRAMEEKSRKFEQEREREREETAPFDRSESREMERSEGASGSLVDELLLQVETQEAIIRDVSNLCDVAEAMCDAQEDRFKQSLMDLPIWASPHELMESLCDQ